MITITEEFYRLKLERIQKLVDDNEGENCVKVSELKEILDATFEGGN